MMCAVCMFDGRRQEDLIDLKDGQIDQLRAERDALAALLQECRDDWLRLAYGASHEDVAAYRDFATRVDAALAGKDAT